jgi:hypothetical protein
MFNKKKKLNFEEKNTKQPTYHYIYNIGVLTVDIEFMWRCLEMGERTSFRESFHPFRARPHKSIFTVNTPILYLSCNKICKKTVI